MALDVELMITLGQVVLKLVAVYLIVLHLLKAKLLPPTTPQVLARVTFSIIIPCYLFCTISHTLATEASVELLWLPLLGTVQVFAGLAIGRVVCYLVYRWPFWKPRAPPAPSLAAAKTVTDAMGVPMATMALVPKEPLPQPKQRLGPVLAACMFGNTFTLPLLFLTSLLGAEQMRIAAGYIAAFILGWSPWLWVVGFVLLSSGSSENLPSVATLLKKAASPPLIGIMAGAFVGMTPLAVIIPGVLDVREGMQHVYSQLPALVQGLGWLCRTAVESMAMLGTGMVAFNTLTLSATLASPIPAGASMGMRALVATCITRFLCIPSVVLGCAVAAKVWLAPSVMSAVDPLCVLVLLIQSAMPSAQNLVVLAQVASGGEGTPKGQAEALSRLIVFQYALSVVPVSLWVAFFMKFCFV